MVENHETHALEAFDWEHLCDSVPELDQFHFRIDAVTLGKPIDSSEMTPEDWILMARTIEENYDHYDGFVLLHGIRNCHLTHRIGKHPVILGGFTEIG